MAGSTLINSSGQAPVGDELSRPPLENYRLSLPYALYVTTPNRYNEGDYLPSNLLFAFDHIESMTVDEPISVVITPTLDGGKYITNRGSVMKDIVISGTTAFMPEDVNANVPFASSVNSLTRETNRQKKSGFIKFIQLRNLIREYARIKRFANPKTANDTLMFFYDQNMSDWWLVEVIDFKMMHTSRKKVMRDFQLILKTVQLGFTTQNDSKAFNLPFSQEQNILNSFQTFLTEVGKVTNRLAALRRDIQSFISGLVGTVRDAFSTLLGPLDELIGFFSTAAFSIDQLRQVPVGLENRLMQSLDGLYEGVNRFESATGNSNEVATGKLMQATNDIYIETRQLSESLLARAAQLYGQISDSNNTLALLDKENIKYTDQRGFALTSAIPNTGATTVDGIPVSESDASMSVSPFVSESGFSTLSPSDFRNFTTVRQDIVGADETIYEFSIRTTGTVYAMQLIAAINGLRTPYFVGIDEPYQAGTLRAGDPILVPAIESRLTAPISVTLRKTPPIAFRGSFEDPGFPYTNDEVFTNLTTIPWRVDQWVGYTFRVVAGTGVGQSALVRSNAANMVVLNAVLATPLDPTSVFTLDVEELNNSTRPQPIADIFGVDAFMTFKRTGNSMDGVAAPVLGPTGDLVSIKGLANYIQAINLLTRSEQGRNPANPLYGVMYPIGQRGIRETIAQYDFSIRSGILADPRTQSVSGFRVLLDKDTLQGTTTVVPVGTDQPLPVNFPLVTG